MLMRSPCCLYICVCVSPITIVEPEVTAVVVFAVTNTQATIEEILDAVFSMGSVSYQVINM
jgi:hypothetical protein